MRFHNTAHLTYFLLVVGGSGGVLKGVKYVSSLVFLQVSEVWKWRDLVYS